MTILLDTHAFVWMAEGDTRLSQLARALIQDPMNTVLVSVASLWEIAIKLGLGKLHLSGGFDQLVNLAAGQDYTILEIDTESLKALITLPLHHRDPFDRLLAATSLNHNVPLVSVDSVFDQYSVNRLW